MIIDINKYTYPLPDDRIAKFPLKNRDHSRLLHYQAGNISHHHFYNIDELLPANTLLLFNNTRVIQARLYFQKSSGANIEIFCLEALDDPSVNDRKYSEWWCMIGNRKKWKSDVLEKSGFIGNNEVLLKASFVEEANGKFKIRFEWNSAHNFFEVLEAFGETPLPPYLHRKALAEDHKTYQTVYARHEGAVAAPTAGLHFSHELIDRLQSKGIKSANVLLHVSAGTFQPVKEANALKHPMHEERISFQLSEIKKLIAHEGPVVCVGTTSLRSIESLYWYGAKLETNTSAEFNIDKLEPYEKNSTLSWKKALQNVVAKMEAEKLNTLWGKTRIFIFPSYTFRIVDGLITNYHQPKSTLILLVAAFVGSDWTKIYQAALNNEYRFLSYGDSSLLWRSEK